MKFRYFKEHTKKYVQLEKALFQDNSEDYTCKIAKTPDEAVELIELGFEYVNEIQGVHLYRKRK